MIKCESKKLKIRLILTEALSASTSHGIPNIVRSNKISIKIMWSFFFLISTCLFSYMMISSILSYYEFDVTTKIRVLHEYRAVFPTVTICNLNQFTTNYSLEYLRNVANGLNLSHVFDEKPENISMMDIANIYTLGTSQIKQLSINSTKKLGYSIDQILISCYFSQKECTPEDFIWYYHPTYGNCYQFNSGFDQLSNLIDLKTSGRTGLFLGLMLELFVGVPDKLKMTTQQFGLMVFIHNKTDPPSSVEGVLVMPSMSTNIAITRTFHSQLPKPYSECDLDELTKKSYRSELYDLVSRNQSFKKKDCIDMCFQKFLYKKCNCTIPFIKTYEPTALPCISDEESNCVADFTYNFSNSEFISENCLPECPTECDRNQLCFQISSSEYSSAIRDEIIKNQPKIKAIYSNESFSTSLRSNMLGLNIFYESLSYTKIEESESMDFVTLLSNIGGIAGLFLGISLLSFVEIFEILLEFAFIVFKN